MILSFRYFFSWRDPNLKGVEYDWLSARNFCRRRCMDSVSLETSLENEWIKQRVVGENVSISVTWRWLSYHDNYLHRVSSDEIAFTLFCDLMLICKMSFYSYYICKSN